MSYVQGVVIPVPAANKDAYREMVAKTAPVFIDHGATRIVECWGEALPDGETTDFRKAVRAEDGETVVFAWIEYPDKAACDAAHEKMWSDPRMKPDAGQAVPFDGRRMIFGGFVPIFDTAG